MKKPKEPSAASLEEMPEINESRFRRRPGRGRHTDGSVGEIVAIDAELWLHFGSAEAVNDALRQVIAERDKASRSAWDHGVRHHAGDVAAPGSAAA